VNLPQIHPSRSRWLYPSELSSLMKVAGMEGASILHDEDLSIFPEFGQHIDEKRQARYKRRALVGIYSRGLKVHMA
jgi:hypothetical protein